MTDIEISDVMNTAETAEGYLGEYAGKGIGVTRGNRVKFSCKKHGYWVHLVAIVPNSQYSQAVDPNLFHLRKFDYYNAGMDGITLVPTPKIAVYGTKDNYTFGHSDFDETQSFGNVPVYSEYKTAYNVLNGDMSLQSARSSYLPFTMDKLLPYDDVAVDIVGDPDNPSDYRYTFSDIDPSIITNGTLWRFIGRHRWLGNYDRIFINEGRQFGFTQNPHAIDVLDNLSYTINDNFIIHNHLDLKVNGEFMPLSDSFDTGAEDGQTISVQHS